MADCTQACVGPCLLVQITSVLFTGVLRAKILRHAFTSAGAVLLVSLAVVTSQTQLQSGFIEHRDMNQAVFSLSGFSVLACCTASGFLNALGANPLQLQKDLRDCSAGHLQCAKKLYKGDVSRSQYRNDAGRDHVDVVIHRSCLPGLLETGCVLKPSGSECLVSDNTPTVQTFHLPGSCPSDPDLLHLLASRPKSLSVSWLADISQGQ